MTSALWRQTGGVWPMGVSCSLTWYDAGAILHVIQTERIGLVIEIGVEHGGLASLLTSYMHYAGVVYHGIDITLNALHPAVRAEERVVERDAWSAATVEEVRQWVTASPAPALLFCDGGDKARELKLYAPLLRPGDVLMGHDYHNEYGDAELAGMPETVVQARADWLDDTLCCMFRRREGV